MSADSTGNSMASAAAPPNADEYSTADEHSMASAAASLPPLDDAALLFPNIPPSARAVLSLAVLARVFPQVAPEHSEVAPSVAENTATPAESVVAPSVAENTATPAESVVAPSVATDHSGFAPSIATENTEAETASTAVPRSGPGMFHT